ncbi:PAS domain S-box protein [Vreelandella lionensis]
MTDMNTDHLYQLVNRSKRNTENVIKTAPLGICITDPHGHFEMVNPAYCQFYGYQEEDLIGQHFTLVVPEAYRPQMRQLHDEFIQGDETRELRQEWEVRCKNGETRTILAEAARIEGDDGASRKVTFIVDITDRKRLEERLKQASRVTLKRRVLECLIARIKRCIRRNRQGAIELSSHRHQCDQRYCALC